MTKFDLCDREAVFACKTCRLYLCGPCYPEHLCGGTKADEEEAYQEALKP